MNSERWEELKDLFVEAKELNGHELNSFLDRKCASDP